MSETRDPRPLASHHTCHYCTLIHRKVEAGGVWYCPNVLCTGPGAASWRGTLRSYRETGHGRHTVDHEEAVTMGLAHAYSLTDEPEIAAHIRASVEKWRTPTERPTDV